MNKVILIGRLTRDPDVRYTQTQAGEQMAIARYNIAVDRFSKDKGADFISCIAFGKQGEFAEKYLKQGMKIAVEGRIQTGSYEKDGIKHYTTDVVIDRHEFCESKSNAESTPPSAPDEVADGFMDIPDDVNDSLPFKK